MQAIFVQDMAFGDCGKGLMTDFLVRENKAELVVRYNGGAQAAHNVISPEGVHHTFSQFGSGTLAGAKTFLSKYMLVDLLALVCERDVLSPKLPGQLQIPMVDPDCVIVTFWHKYANKLREVARGSAKHGSVGMGVGEARSDAIQGLALRVRDLRDRSRCLSTLRTIKEKKLAEMKDLGCVDSPLYKYMEHACSPENLTSVYLGLAECIRICTFEEATKDIRCAVFEGAQGFLLDEEYGFEPYNSWTDCTFGNAYRVLGEGAFLAEGVFTVGVFRSYFTRHGPGPFVTEDPEICVPEKHNQLHPWMGNFRQGHFDMVMAKYACSVALPDVLVVTHMDCRPSPFVCDNYSNGFHRSSSDCTKSLFGSQPRYSFVSDDEFPKALEQDVGIPVRYLSYGPCSKDVVKRKGMTPSRGGGR